MNYKLNKVLLYLFFTISLNGQNINYGSLDMHTLTLPKGTVNLAYESLMMNDTVDILKIKQSEFGNNQNYDSIGDMKGYNLKLRYGITDDLMVNLQVEKKSIEYGSNSLNNNKTDIFVRYNLFNYPYANLNSGLSFDVGYVKNQLDDFYLYDLKELNSLGNKILGTTNLEIQQLPSGTYAIPDTTTPNPFDFITLTDKPSVALKDTSDESYYSRLLTGYYTQNSALDFYIGYKRTKIKNLITANSEIVQLAANQGYDLEKYLDRSESMLFLGASVIQEYEHFILEFNYEYEKFERTQELKYIDFNHIIDLSLNYKVSDQVLLYAGAKIMYRQLNGQIPYLYNEYTQTSYDHKYGYTKFGVQYRF